MSEVSSSPSLQLYQPHERRRQAVLGLKRTRRQPLTGALLISVFVFLFPGLCLVSHSMNNTRNQDSASGTFAVIDDVILNRKAIEAWFDVTSRLARSRHVGENWKSGCDGVNEPISGLNAGLPEPNSVKVCFRRTREAVTHHRAPVLFIASASRRRPRLLMSSARSLVV